MKILVLLFVVCAVAAQVCKDGKTECDPEYEEACCCAGNGKCDCCHAGSKCCTSGLLNWCCGESAQCGTRLGECLAKDICTDGKTKCNGDEQCCCHHGACSCSPKAGYFCCGSGRCRSSQRCCSSLGRVWCCSVGFKCGRNRHCVKK